MRGLFCAGSLWNPQIHPPNEQFSGRGYGNRNCQPVVADRTRASVQAQAALQELNQNLVG